LPWPWWRRLSGTDLDTPQILKTPWRQLTRPKLASRYSVGEPWHRRTLQARILAIAAFNQRCAILGFTTKVSCGERDDIMDEIACRITSAHTINKHITAYN
jgi:hypothetical protein